MEITFDPRLGVAYITLRDDIAVVETVTVGDNLAVDLGPDGAVFGIELLGGVEQFRSSHGGRITVTNQATRRSIHVNLPN